MFSERNQKRLPHVVPFITVAFVLLAAFGISTPVHAEPLASDGATTVQFGLAIVSLSGSGGTFYITSLPSTGTISSFAGVIGPTITADQLPYALPGSAVAYVPSVTTGTDSFTFAVSDETGTSTATQTLNMTPVNIPANPNPALVFVPQNTTTQIALSGTGSVSGYVVKTLPSSGTLSLSAVGQVLGPAITTTDLVIPGAGNTLYYRPNLNSTTNDSFLFAVKNGATESGAASVALVIQGGSAIPLSATGGSLSLPVGHSTDITLNGTSEASFVITALGAGTLMAGAHTIMAGELPYTIPAQGNVVHYTAPLTGASDSFNFEVTDGQTTSNNATETITLIQGPSFAPIANQTVNAGATVTLTAGATPAVSGSAITYALATGAPTGATITAAGEFSWATTNLDIGTHTITVVANEAGGASATQSFTVIVNPVSGGSPLLALPGFATVSKNTVQSIVLGGTGSIVSFVVTALPTSGTLTVGAHVITAGELPYTIPAGGSTVVYTPNTDYVGVDALSFEVMSASATSSAVSYFLSIVDVVPLTPVFNPIADQTVEAGATATTTVHATVSASGDTVVYSLASTSPSGATIDTLTGVFTWTPGLLDAGVHTITVIATEAAGVHTQASFTVTVTLPISVPLFAQPRFVSLAKNSSTTITLLGTGPIIGYTVVTLPTSGTLMDGARVVTAGDLPYTIAASGNMLTYTPTITTSGADQFDFTVSSASATSASAVVTIAITDPSLIVPTLGPIADKTIAAGSILTFTATATPALIADAVTFNLGAGAPNTAFIDPTTGVFTWAPALNQAGNYTIMVVATEAGGASTTQSFTVTVTAPISAPFFAIPGFAALFKNASTSLTLNSTGGVTNYSITALPVLGVLQIGDHTIAAGELPYGIPGGANTLTYIPNTDVVGADQFAFAATNGVATSTALFLLAINDPAVRVPTFEALADQTVTAGAVVTATASATPALIGDTVTYALDSSAPTGATIDPVTGAFSWTTGSGDVGAHVIVIRASESDGGTTAQSFTVTVNAASGSSGGGGSSSGGGGGGGGGSIIPAGSFFLGSQGLGDINKDGHVDIADFTILMAQWGQTGADKVADLNHDGIVDIFDFNALLTNWTL